MSLIAIEIEKTDAEWLLAYLASVKREEARRIRNEIEIALENDDAADGKKST